MSLLLLGFDCLVFITNVLDIMSRLCIIAVVNSLVDLPGRMALSRINKVALYWARLVLGWVTVYVQAICL